MARDRQPAAPVAGPQPAPLQLKFFFVPGVDATGAAVTVAAQGMCLTDDQGRAFQPMSEQTGRRLLKVMNKLCVMTAQQYGVIFTPEEMPAPGVD